MSAARRGPELTVDVELGEDGRAAAIRCEGVVDSSTFTKLDETMTELFEAGFRAVVMDLSAVSYMSSSGIGVIVWSRREAEEHGGGMVLLNPSEQILKIISTLNIDKELPVVCSEEEGWRALGVKA